uniref:FkbM family methyltransferase n=1 Tax=Stenotrophomonas sp. TaxID=69392 RepID=UPI0031F2D776
MFNMISYAQNFEDVILWRALGHIEQGRYIDVGAQSPDEHSVSRLFYDKGWRGVHVEPTQHYSTLLRERRADEQVLQAAVSDARGELRFFDITD